MKWFRLFRMNKNGNAPQYEDLPDQIKKILKFRRDEVQFIEEQRRIVVRFEDSYSVWQYNPITEGWVLVREKRMAQ